MQTLRSTVRTRLVLAAFALLLILAFRPSPGFGAANGGYFQVRYAAHDFYVFGPDHVAAAVGSKTGTHLAPLGAFEFTTTDDDFSIRLDDEAPLRFLPVYVVSPSTRGKWHCVPNHGTETLGGFRARETIYVQINAATYGYSMCGVGGATAGIATVIR